MWKKQHIKPATKLEQHMMKIPHTRPSMSTVPSRVLFVMAPNDHEASLHPPTRPEWLIWNYLNTQKNLGMKNHTARSVCQKGQRQPTKVSIEIPNHQLRHDQSFQPPPIDNANQLRQANTGNYSLLQLSREMAKWALPCKRFLPSELIGSPILPPYPT